MVDDSDVNGPWDSGLEQNDKASGITTRKVTTTKTTRSITTTEATDAVAECISHHLHQDLDDNNFNKSCWVYVYYVLFGAIHECAHMMVASYLLSSHSCSSSSGSGDYGTTHNGNNITLDTSNIHVMASMVPWLYRTILGRSYVVPTEYLMGSCNYNNRNVTFSLWAIRHAGWVVSVGLVILLEIYVFRCARKSRYQFSPFRQSLYWMRYAAILTAVEAIVTDLLQLHKVFALLPFGHSSSSPQTTFYCGNFGIIVLHHLWLSNRSEQSTVLDVLEKMIQVTMMRGAQSGGVVTYIPIKQSTSRTNHNTTGSSTTGNTASRIKIKCKGVRSRIVNRKRTDLAKCLRNKVQADVFGNRGLSCVSAATVRSTNFVPCTFAGHTRFATSSKATLDGTHPHQWTPPSLRRIYDDMSTCSKSTIATMQRVENYISHNGDFDYYVLNNITYDIEVIQKWLVHVTHCPSPAPVDSAAVAGMVDILRTQGCFGLSARFAICLGLPTSTIQEKYDEFPDYDYFERIGMIFERSLTSMLVNQSNGNMSEWNFDSTDARNMLVVAVTSEFEKDVTLLRPLAPFLSLPLCILAVDDCDDREAGGTNGRISSVLIFCKVTIDAFFDNDLFFATKAFLQNGKGSFGLCISSSLDAHKQICLAARGQTMSIAFYPNKGLICYGSEQAAVKAGMNVDFPTNKTNSLGRSRGDVDNDSLRLDLDDLGGEIVCIDWSGCAGTRSSPPVSKPNRGLVRHKVMNGEVELILYQQSKATTQDPQIYHRMTCLSRNRFIKPLRNESIDLILTDIQDIPKICKLIQDEWKSDRAASSLNRLTAYNLSRCVRARLESHVDGTVHPRAIDILLTGCEVSLWLAEQFASDLQKSFPALRILAVSSNKLLGLFGQEIAVPAIGFPYGQKTHHLHDTIVIIVSHSGGTFAPLSCSNLLQSSTQNIFVVTSEWDTQIGKQLRMMDSLDDEHEDHLFRSRIFSTEVGMRPAEPCSISVVATHQLLTNLLEYICVVVLSDDRFRRVTCSHITEEHLLVLEKCNQMNIEALSEIVGVNEHGVTLLHKAARTEAELRAAGDVWADHILEVARAYMMTFVYIFVTVISQFPLFYAIAFAAGLDKSNPWIYVIHTLDAAVYFWLPQINITILRLIQGRNLLHRMVGRTVVIGDIPYVAQCAEAFLSKIFAVSYSIAGLNVLSGNPSDHFVHRHTHRVVRGSLIICGRPDGRLSALSTAESAVCLSVNQASSIQSWGGTCESVTIGHNPFQLALSAKGIFLPRKRPLFLCERLLVETDVKGEPSTSPASASGGSGSQSIWETLKFRICRFVRRRRMETMDLSRSRHLDSSLHPRVHTRRSSMALTGAYLNLDRSKKGVKEISCDSRKNSSDIDVISAENTEDNDKGDQLSLNKIVAQAIRERHWSNRARKIFQALDLNQNGFISEGEFLEGVFQLNAGLSNEQARQLFQLAETDIAGLMSYDEFLNLLEISDLDSGVKLPPCNRNSLGIIQIEPSKEKYFGETLRKYNKVVSRAGKKDDDVEFRLARSQDFSQELYETRIASIQRFVAMTVMFHQMGKRVQGFFATISFGLLAYRIDRTHSIMRIASTASPISGADLLQRMRQIQLMKKVHHSLHVISVAYLRFKVKKERERIKILEKEVSSVLG